MRSLVVLLSTLAIASARLGFDAAEVMRALVLMLSSLAVALATRGFDAAQAISTAQFECMKAKGYSFYIARIYRSNGAVSEAINAVKSGGTKIGMVWLDIEIYKWPSSQVENRNFIVAMVTQAVTMGYKVGIYTSYNNWQSIVGIDWNGVSKYPLWWADYNGEESFNDFRPFGGWSKPAMHQAKGIA